MVHVKNQWRRFLGRRDFTRKMEAIEDSLVALGEGGGGGGGVDDTGNVLGGVVDTEMGGSGVAVGPGSTVTNGSSDAVAVGDATVTNGSIGGVAIGKSAEVTSGGSVAIGHNSVAATGAVAVGTGASPAVPLAPDYVAVGVNAVGNAYGVAVGGSATAGAAQSVAVGRYATAEGVNGVAVGSGAQALEPNSVAIGNQAVADAEGLAVIATDTLRVDSTSAEQDYATTLQLRGPGGLVHTIGVDEDGGLTVDGVGAVALAGAQTVDGVKTFTSHPVLPGDPTSDLQAATKKYVDDRVSGILVVESVDDIPSGLPVGTVVLVLEPNPEAEGPSVIGFSHAVGEASSLTFTIPEDVTDGDLLFAFLTSQRDSSTASWTIDDGWTTAVSTVGDPEQRVAAVAFVAGSDALAGQTKTFSATGDPGRASGVLVAIRGGHIDDLAVGTPGGQNGVNVTGPLSVPGALAPRANSLHVVFSWSNGNVGSGHNPAAPTIDSSFTLVGGGPVPAEPTGGFTTARVWVRLLESAGASGSTTLTYANIAQQGGVALVIPPPPEGA